MENKYQSEFLGSLHETAAGLYQIGVITEAEMREYNRNCLAHKPNVASQSDGASIRERVLEETPRQASLASNA